MGRGRQKAKQTKMARKLKYMKTDTDYNELERELASQEEENQDNDSPDPADDRRDGSLEPGESNGFDDLEPAFQAKGRREDKPEDLDDYAAWAAEAAKKADRQAMKKPVPHKPFPKMPFPSGLKPKSAK